MRKKVSDSVSSIDPRERTRRVEPPFPTKISQFLDPIFIKVESRNAFTQHNFWNYLTTLRILTSMQVPSFLIYERAIKEG